MMQRTKCHRFLSLLLCLVLVLSLLPAVPASAALAESLYVGGQWLDLSKESYWIHNESGLIREVDKIFDNWTVHYDGNYNLTLRNADLAGTNLLKVNGAAIYFSAQRRFTVTLAEGSVNTLRGADGIESVFQATALYAASQKGTLHIVGNGELKVGYIGTSFTSAVGISAWGSLELDVAKLTIEEVYTTEPASPYQAIGIYTHNLTMSGGEYSIIGDERTGYRSIGIECDEMTGDCDRLTVSSVDIGIWLNNETTKLEIPMVILDTNLVAFFHNANKKKTYIGADFTVSTGQNINNATRREPLEDVSIPGFHQYVLPELEHPYVVISGSYNVWVGGEQVTRANKDDVLGDGKVCFSLDTGGVGRLTLKDGAEITGTSKGINSFSGQRDYTLPRGAAIYAAKLTYGTSRFNNPLNGLIVSTQADAVASVTGVDAAGSVGIYCSDMPLQFLGSGTLNVSGGEATGGGFGSSNTAIDSDGRLTVGESAVVNATADGKGLSGYVCAVRSSEALEVSQNAALYAAASGGKATSTGILTNADGITVADDACLTAASDKVPLSLPLHTADASVILGGADFTGSTLTKYYEESLSFYHYIKVMPWKTLAQQQLPQIECTVPMEAANTESEVLLWLNTQWLKKLPIEFSSLIPEDMELSVATVSDFSPAVARTPANQTGTDGSASFQLQYQLGEGEVFTLPLTLQCRIKTPFYVVTHGQATVHLKLDGEVYPDATVMLRNSVGDEYILIENVSDHTHAANVLLGTYEIIVDDNATGETITVGVDGATSTLEYYTVTFSSQGASVSPEQDSLIFLSGTTIRPVALARNQQPPIGWYRDSDCTPAMKWDMPNDVVTEPITLYPKWANEVDVVLTLLKDDNQLYTGVNVTLVLGEFTYPLTYADGVYRATSVPCGAYRVILNGVTDLGYTNFSDAVEDFARTYYFYTVTFNGSGATITPINNQVVVLAGYHVSMLSGFVNSGFSPLGWYESPDFSGDAWNFTEDRVNQTMTLYPKWPPSYPVTLTLTKDSLPFSGQDVMLRRSWQIYTAKEANETGVYTVSGLLDGTYTITLSGITLGTVTVSGAAVEQSFSFTGTTITCSAAPPYRFALGVQGEYTFALQNTSPDMTFLWSMSRTLTGGLSLEDTNTATVTLCGRPEVATSGLREITLTGCAKQADGSFCIASVPMPIIVSETLPPTGTITIGTQSWNSALSEIDFDSFYNAQQTVTITGADSLSGVQKIEYALAAQPVSDLASLIWTDYSGSFVLSENRSYIVYARVTDYSGNTCLINSNGFVLDNAPPTISGIVDEDTYCVPTEVTVTDANSVSVTLDGTPVELVNGKFTLTAAEFMQTILATDAAGNTTQYAVRINDGHAPLSDDGNCTTPVLCGVCSEIAIPAKAHDYSGSYIFDETTHWHVCSNAGCTASTAAQPHTAAPDAAIAATCTREGYTEGEHCADCEALLSVQLSLPPLGHNIVTDLAVPATCAATGLTEGSHCTRCTDVTVAQIVIAKLPHTEVIDEAVAATCTATGLTEGKHCSVCNEVLITQQTVASLGHDIVIDPALAATCTATGLTEGSHCTRCTDMTVVQVEIAKLPHTPAVVPAVAATCTATGLTEGSKCSVCDEILVAQSETAKLPHTPAVVPAVAATCTAAGLSEGSKCSVCDEILVAQTETAKLPHTPAVVPAVVATCAAAGLTEGSKCSVCNEILVAQTEIEKLPHTPAVVPAVAATCAAAGLTEGSKCSVCNEILVAQSETAKLPHTPAVVPALAATCTATGLTEGSKCSVCDEILVAQTGTAKLPHTEVIDEAVAATCIQTGLTEGKHCSVCNEILVAQSETAKLPHTPAVVPALAATCTATGLTEGSKCSVCDEILVAQETVNALGHDWDEGVVTKAPTATEQGEMTYTCSRCNEIRTEEIPETGEITLPFTDVPEGKWFTEAVKFVYRENLFSGISATEFSPNSNMTRGMLVTVLWRLDGKPTPEGENTFNDVAAGKYYTNAVTWAAESGVVDGVGNGKFIPDGNVTREQIAAIMFRYANFKGYNTSKTADLSKFPDSDKVSGWAKTALAWANAEALIGGTIQNGATVLDPQGNATRAQVAMILMRYVNNIVNAK